MSGSFCFLLAGFFFDLVSYAIDCLQVVVARLPLIGRGESVVSATDVEIGECGNVRILVFAVFRRTPNPGHPEEDGEFLS